ncbi:MAG: diguanylate cyclase [Myxococcota bacterium]
MSDKITAPKILIIEDDDYIAQQAKNQLKRENYKIKTVTNKKFSSLKSLFEFDLIIASPARNITNIYSYVNEVRKKAFAVPVIAVVDGKSESILGALKGGAFDYIQKPLETAALPVIVFRVLEHHRLLKENQALYEYIELYAACKRIITQIDAEDLRASALEAFVAESNGRVGFYALMLPKYKEARLFETLGMDEQEGRQCVSLLQDYIKEEKFKSSPIQRVDLEKIFPPTSILRRQGFNRAEILLLKDETENYGVLIALGHKSDEFNNPKFENNAVFLARHVIIGWNNVKKHASAQRMAFLDPLTGLYNSTYIEQELKRFMSHTEKRPMVALFLDLDHFKLVNDNHGHLNGSEVLVEAAKVLKRCVRETDVVARFGGDEFIILLRNTPLSDGLKVAERIRKKIESQHFLGREGFTIKITTCIGVASYPEHSQSYLDLVGLADKAMYIGKNSGRNQVNISPKRSG